MQTYTCAACEFTFTEADKTWRDAIGTWQCPNCLKKLHDFPPGAQRTPEAELAIARPDVDYGIALMAIPAVGTMLIWFWVSGMNLLQSPQNSLALIMITTIVGTGIVAAMEASKVMTELERKNGTSSPGLLFFSFLLLWFVAYPAYMFNRRTHGLPNLLAAGILLMLIFVGSSFALNSAIESKKDEIRKGITDFQSQLKSLSEPDAEAKKALEDLQSQLALLAKQQQSAQPAPTLVPAPAADGHIQALVSEAPNGEYVHAVSTDRSDIYYFPSSIQKSGNTSTMWVLQNFKQIERADGFSYISTKTKNEYDCQSKKARGIGVIAYDSPIGNGKAVYSGYVGNQEFNSVILGSVSDSLWNIVCQKQGGELSQTPQ